MTRIQLAAVLSFFSIFALAAAAHAVPLSVHDGSLTTVNWDGCVARARGGMQSMGWGNMSAGGVEPGSASQTIMVGGQHPTYTGFILCRPLGAAGSTYTVIVAGDSGTNTESTRLCLAEFMKSGSASASCGGGGARGGGPAASCADLSGRWDQTTPGVATTSWTLTPLGGGRYQAAERGGGTASGTATVSGSQLRIDWVTGAWSGYYVWNLDATCTGGSGSLVFLSGGSGAHASTVKRGG